MTTTEPLNLPAVPDDLGESGAALFRAITEEYELRPDELTVLHSAARLRDTVDVLKRGLQDQPLTVKGSTGQPVAHPLIPEVRQTESALAALLGKLKLHEPALVEQTTTVLHDGPMTRSESGRKAARTRWAR